MSASPFSSPDEALCKHTFWRPEGPNVIACRRCGKRSVILPAASVEDELTVWTLEPDVLCVACPRCAFTFEAGHEDEGHRARYTCPNCGCQGELSEMDKRDYALRSRP